MVTVDRLARVMNGDEWWMVTGWWTGDVQCRAEPFLSKSPVLDGVEFSALRLALKPTKIYAKNISSDQPRYCTYNQAALNKVLPIWGSIDS
jgi:hypothetical protein